MIDDVSVDFRPGQMNLIIGPNGSGKSTLIKAISKQMAFEGQVRYDGRDVTGLAYQDLARFRAVLSQHTEVAFPLKVSEVVMMGRYPHFRTHPGAVDQQAVDEAMDYFDVKAMADRDYTTLSGGEKQRVNFARVLAQIWFSVPGQMRYLLLDEPLTFLDVNFQYQFMRKLQQLEQQNDLVIVGVIHDLNLAARFGDSLLLLLDGRMLASGTLPEVLTKENIQQAFHISVDIIDHKGALHLSF